MLRALIQKELRQIKKDQSILIIAFFLPLMLIFIYGYGLNLDVKNIKVGLQCDFNNVLCEELYYKLDGSEYLEAYSFNTKSEAQKAFNAHKIHAVVFSEDNEFLLYINAKAAHLASLIEAYLLSSLQSDSSDNLNIIVRNRFNEENKSVYFLLPGQLIGIITLICAFMSSLLIAREYDKNTIVFMQSHKVTAKALLFSKLIPYYVLSALGSIFAILVALILFDLPFRGSLPLFALTFLIYILMANSMGLLISVLVKDQFLASEYAIIISLLPSLLLSGALFDLKATADFIYYLSFFIPPRYAVEAFKLSFLSDGGYERIFENCAILLFYSVLFLALSYIFLKKDLRC